MTIVSFAIKFNSIVDELLPRIGINWPHTPPLPSHEMWGGAICRHRYAMSHDQLSIARTFRKIWKEESSAAKIITGIRGEEVEELIGRGCSE